MKQDELLLARNALLDSFEVGDAPVEDGSNMQWESYVEAETEQRMQQLRFALANPYS